MTRTRVCTCMVVLGMVAASAAVAQPPHDWRAQQLAAMDKSDAIMQRAQAKQALLAQYQVLRRAYASDHGAAFRTIFGQYLSWYQSFIGDYQDAEQAFSIDQLPLAGDAPSPLNQPGWHAVPALAFIPNFVRGQRAVFLNEAHNIALTRTLTVRLLRPLREAGFNVFAVETLYPADIDALNRRGYATADSGFYTREPIYAEVVRTALRLGYKVIAYEADANHLGNAREAQQAANLWRVLKDDPKARLVVNAGYAHIQKAGKFLGADSMAQHFMQLSGIIPISIEQTALIPHQHRGMNHPSYSAIVAVLHPKIPVVLINRNAQPWSLRAGYDASVIFPEQEFIDGRPTWAALWGARVPVRVNGQVCRRHWPCMVAARYADDAADAIPADRMVLDPVPLTTINDIVITDSNYGMPSGQLYLRPGYRYRLTISDEHQTIGTSTLSVRPEQAGATACTPTPTGADIAPACPAATGAP